ncbi:MAG TPA: DUF5657 family protein [Patescibacteria group bacterium]|nr:DUF5657 family protein [Patescibacteria group bacterium]
MSPEQLFSLQTQGASLVLKIGLVAVLFLVGIFLFVVLKQIRAMNRIVTQPDMFPYLHSFVLFLGLCTIALIILTIVIL